MKGYLGFSVLGLGHSHCMQKPSHSSLHFQYNALTFACLVQVYFADLIRPDDVVYFPKTAVVKYLYFSYVIVNNRQAFVPIQEDCFNITLVKLEFGP